MRNLVHFGAVLLLLPLGAPALAADIPMSLWSEAAPPVVQRDRLVARIDHQCVGFLDGRPISDDMLGPMHDAGCCDFLIAMHPDQRLQALEQRLLCEAYQEYKDEHGVAPMSLAVINQPNPPPPPAPVVAPPAPAVAPPAPVAAPPAPVVAPVEAEPAVAPDPIEIDGDPPLEEEFNIF